VLCWDVAALLLFIIPLSLSDEAGSPRKRRRESAGGTRNRGQDELGACVAIGEMSEFKWPVSQSPNVTTLHGSIISVRVQISIRHGNSGIRSARSGKGLHYAAI